MSGLASSRFIFVGGSPRSGTTLVQNILDSHPDICGGPEFIHLQDIIQLRNKLHKSITKGWISNFCSHNNVNGLTASLIEDLLLPLADKYESKFLSEKTPSNVLVFSELIDLFPEAHFIHVIRDPRAIIASMLQVGIRGKQHGRNTQDFTRSVPIAIDYVRQCFKSGFAAVEQAPKRVLTISYEQLVTNPEQEIKRICNFLDIEWVSQMMQPGAQKHLGEKAICNEIWYNKKTYNRNLETKEIDKWQRQLTSLQKIQITAAFRNSKNLLVFAYNFSDGLSLLENRLSLVWSTLRQFLSRRRFRHRIRKKFKEVFKDPLKV